MAAAVDRSDVLPGAEKFADLVGRERVQLAERSDAGEHVDDGLRHSCGRSHGIGQQIGRCALRREIHVLHDMRRCTSAGRAHGRRELTEQIHLSPSERDPLGPRNMVLWARPWSAQHSDSGDGYLVARSVIRICGQHGDFVPLRVQQSLGALAHPFWNTGYVQQMDGNQANQSSAAPTALVVDWGGVLTEAVDQAMRSWVEQEPFSIEQVGQVLRQWLGPQAALETAINPVHTLERGELEVAHFERRLAGELSSLSGTDIDPDGLLDRMMSHFRHAPAMNALVVRARESGLRTALLSNSWGNRYPDHLFDGMFDAVVISGQVGLRKPEPAIYHHTVELLGLPTAQCVFVDDIKTNVDAAVDVGMIGVHHTAYDSTAMELSALFGVELAE